MKRSIFPVLFAFLLSACNGWVIQPLPYTPPTPFQATNPPVIYSATPIIIGVTSASATPFLPTATSTPTSLPTSTNMPSLTPSATPTNTFTPTSPGSTQGLSITILGCNTDIDITHGMGEVTNAFVTLKNIGSVELTNLRATLYALDEGRVHPDKTVELTSLPAGYQVTVKLTVDSTYKADTPIQVEVITDQGTFPREGSDSCRDLGIFVPKLEGLKTPVPIQ
ncbi:MAG: hypothetical protein FIB03_05415 [Anaerolineae bacterium]|nr:hypothetical protein [Anaerolineae bacterium]